MEVRITAGRDVERVHFCTLCRGFCAVNKIQWTEPVLCRAVRHNPPLHLSHVKDTDNSTVNCFNI
jgi:tRNA-dihydrouridine synthase